MTSRIAEILYPRQAVADEADSREVYPKRARESYRRLTLSPLRKALEIVERDFNAERFDAIKYEQVPSLAMNRYMNLFAEKDFAHFSEYIDEIARGVTRISGAVLTPGKLISQAVPKPNRRRPLSSKATCCLPRQLRASGKRSCSESAITASFPTPLLSVT